MEPVRETPTLPARADTKTDLDDERRRLLSRRISDLGLTIRDTSLINRVVEVAWKRSEATPFLKELQKTRAERARRRKQAARALHNIDSIQDKNTSEPDALASPPS